MNAPTPAATRGEQTKRLIVDTALRLFRERGYAKTTMRAIAAEAGVSVGNAYYYFDSKEHLIQAFYEQIQVDHRAAARAVLEREDALGARLSGVLHAAVDTMAPYHEFAGRFIQVAADPSSPVSPFSDESSPARDASLAIWREAVEGSSTKIIPELREELPELLWLAHLGLTLFWVHDGSPEQAKTRVVIDRAVPLVVRLVGLSRIPGLRSVTRDGLALLRYLRE